MKPVALDMSLRQFCNAMIDGLDAVNSAIAKTGLRIAATFLVIMVAIVLGQVFFRYVLNDSIVWAEELSKAMMVWVAFLVAPAAMLQGANVKIEMLVEAVPYRLRYFLKLVIGLATLWVLGIFLEESLGFWERGRTVSAASLPIPVSTFYSIVPVGFSALILATVQVFLQDLRSLFSPEIDAQNGHTSVDGGGA